MKTAIVFGAKGQIGYELIALAPDRGLDFRGLSRSQVDITDVTAVKSAFEKYVPALAINCAAYTAVDRAEQETELANAINADGAEIVAETSASLNVPLVHLSTDYVFDGNKKGAYTESDMPAPINVYGHSKLQGEKRVQASCKNHVILRTSWVYGPHGNNFLRTILHLAKERDELRVISDQYGCPTSTADIAEAIIGIAEKLLAHEDVSGTYHFAGIGRANWCEFATEIVNRQSAFTGRSPKVIPISTSEYPAAARRPMNSELDSERFSAKFGYSAKPWKVRVAQIVNALLAPGKQSKAAS